MTSGNLAEAEELLETLSSQLAVQCSGADAPDYRKLLWASTLTTLALIRSNLDAEYESLLDRALALFAQHNWTANLREQMHRANYGVCLIERGRIAEGIKELEATIASGIATPDVYLQLGRAHKLLGDLPATEDALRRAASTSPSHPEVRLELANVLQTFGGPYEVGAAYVAAVTGYVLAGRVELALQTIDHAISVGVQSSSLFLFRAVLLLQSGDAAEALLAANRALELAPNEVIASLAKGRALKYLNQFDRALPVLTEACRQVPNDATIQFDLATVLTELKQYGPAQNHLDLAAQCGMDPVIVNELKARLLAITGAEAEALSLLDYILNAHRHSAPALAVRGYLNHKRREFSSAEADLRDVITIDPSLAWARLELVDTLHDAGSFAQALVALDEVIAMLPPHAWALGMKGRLLNLLGDYEAAIPVLNSAIALQPTEPSNYYWLGWSFEGLNDAPQALAAYLSALENGPEDLWGMKGVADALSLSGRKAEARPYYERVVSTLAGSELSAEMAALKGWCCYRLGQYSDALSLYQQALEQDDRMIPSIFDFGLILLCSGRDSVGAREYRRGINLLHYVTPDRRKAYCRVAIHDLEVAATEYPGESALIAELIASLNDARFRVSDRDSDPSSRIDNMLILHEESEGL
jgi:tetratricopeptide (TPR) repeat protein